MRLPTDKDVTMMENLEFYDKISQDVKQVLIQLVSEAGHGKTSSLRTIIQHCKRQHPEIKFVIVDTSQAWYHNAPVQYRQLVTREKLAKGLVSNQYDTVYEIGSLSEIEKRMFVGILIGQHYRQRYQAKLDETLDSYPFLVFVFEEANIYFGSYSFRKNDEHTHIFQQFVSVGRNYKMRGFLIATAEEREMSPSLRRRSRKIYGRLESEGDLRKVGRKYPKLREYLKTTPKYHFIYVADKSYGPVKVPDAVSHTPEDFVTEQTIEEKPRFDSGWWIKFFGTIAIFLMFWAYLMRM